jgi:hypothetical protein
VWFLKLWRVYCCYVCLWRKLMLGYVSVTTDIMNIVSIFTDINMNSSSVPCSKILTRFFLSWRSLLKILQDTCKWLRKMSQESWQESCHLARLCNFCKILVRFLSRICFLEMVLIGGSRGKGARGDRFPLCSKNYMSYANFHRPHIDQNLTLTTSLPWCDSGSAYGGASSALTH